MIDPAKYEPISQAALQFMHDKVAEIVALRTELEAVRAENARLVEELQMVRLTHGLTLAAFETAEARLTEMRDRATQYVVRFSPSDKVYRCRACLAKGLSPLGMTHKPDCLLSDDALQGGDE